MHLNNVNICGRIAKNGPKLQYASSGSATCSFTLEVDEIAKGGEVFTLYVPCELWGHAESAAETLEAGDEVMLSGRLKYKSVVDAKTQAKVSKLIVSSWGISQRLPATTAPSQEQGGEPIVQPEGSQGAKPRKPRYPKATKAPWMDSRLNQN